jgi:hypothetical protein
MTNRPLVQSEGHIAWVGNRKSGFEWLLQPEETTNKYERRLIDPGRSTVSPQGRFRVGQKTESDTLRRFSRELLDG